MAHRLAPQVEVELDEIWYYIARDSGSMEIADRLIDAITDRFFLLGNHPYVGRLCAPQETAAHFGWLGIFVGRDLIGSSVQTQARLGWRSTGPNWPGTDCRPRTNVLFGDPCG
jgi:plasmid stabilization system protein ParE